MWPPELSLWGSTIPVLSAFPDRSDASVPLSSSWPAVGCSPGHPCSSLFYCGAPNWTLQRVAWIVLSEGCEESPWPASSIFPNASQNAVGLLCSTLLARVPLDVHQDLQSLFCQAAFQLNAPKHTLVSGVVSPQMQKFALFLVNCMKSMSAHFSSLLRHLCMAAWPFGISATYSTFVS